MSDRDLRARLAGFKSDSAYFHLEWGVRLVLLLIPGSIVFVCLVVYLVGSVPVLAVVLALAVSWAVGLVALVRGLAGLAAYKRRATPDAAWSEVLVGVWGVVRKDLF